mmetsp:Transcript_56069/g.133060  ORF Transcript_56069/g.133060 Transcript_56069/m.133060 type:complete len:342 (+) Transcript_56069:23-1048(+)
MGFSEDEEPEMVSTSEAKLAEKESVAPATERAAASVEPKAMLAAASAAAIPYLDKAADLVEKASPYCLMAFEKGKALLVKLEPYKLDVWGPALFGLLLVFFGGRFLSTVAAVEAVRMMGFHRLWDHVQKLHINYQNGLIAARKDGDAGAEGKPQDKGKMLLVMLKSVNPEQVAEALHVVYEYLIAIVATLRFKFAAAVTLGSSIGEMFHQGVDHMVHPMLERAVPREYHKWIAPATKVACRVVAVSLALLLQRVVSAFHSSIRGAYIFVISAQKAAVKLGYLRAVILEEDSPGFSVAVAGVAGLGFLNQVVYGFGLPFPFYILFFPVYVVEWLLSTFIGIV